MTPPSDAGDETERSREDDLSADDVVEAMDPLEPYTTSELASIFDVPRSVASSLLQTLLDRGEVRRKAPASDRPIWVRKPPAHACPECGREFEVRFLHPVLWSVQYCPHCGTTME